MELNVNQLLDELETIQTKDEILAEVFKKCREILYRLEPLGTLRDLKIYVTDFNAASKELRHSAYYTGNLKAVLEPPAIIVNADFLLELEAAFRSFDLSESLIGSQYIRSDEDLFSLVKRIRQASTDYLARLRKLEHQENRRKHAYIVMTLTMVTLFFISHEIGHLLDNKNERSYTSFLQSDARLEYRVANAVVKLCRHASEFAKYGFDLPGGEMVLDEMSEIRGWERDLAKQIETLKLNHTKWFDDEASADRQGTEILLGYLKGVAQRDIFIADQYHYMTIKGLFTTALYSWYRDLLIFGEKMGIHRAPDSQMLMLRMSEDRKTYIRAASLFGEFHRFTLLRAVLAIEAIIRSHSDFFDRKADAKTIWWSREHVDRDSSPNDTRGWWQKIFVWRPEQADQDRELLRQWWQKESLQHYYLLSILMDKAVKIAYMGCATGWILEVDRKRGTPQLFLMTFESIGAAVQRLRQIQ